MFRQEILQLLLVSAVADLRREPVTAPVLKHPGIPIHGTFILLLHLLGRLADKAFQRILRGHGTLASAPKKYGVVLKESGILELPVYVVTLFDLGTQLEYTGRKRQNVSGIQLVYDQLVLLQALLKFLKESSWISLLLLRCQEHVPDGRDRCDRRNIQILQLVDIPLVHDRTGILSRRKRVEFIQLPLQRPKSDKQIRRQSIILRVPLFDRILKPAYPVIQIFICP